MAKLVIQAVDIRKNPLEHGTDESARKILKQCEEKNLPVLFSGTRKEIGNIKFIILVVVQF